MNFILPETEVQNYCLLSVFKVHYVSFKVHRKAFFTFNCDVPGVSFTTVLTMGMPGPLVFQFTDNNAEGFEAFGHVTIWLTSTLTDGFDYVGGGLDEGICLFALIAVGFGDTSTSYLSITSIGTHLPFDMLSYKLFVTFCDVCIRREHSGRKQQQTSKWDPHDFLVTKMLYSFPLENLCRHS